MISRPEFKRIFDTKEKIVFRAECKECKNTPMDKAIIKCAVCGQHYYLKRYVRALIQEVKDNGDFEYQIVGRYERINPIAQPENAVEVVSSHPATILPDESILPTPPGNTEANNPTTA